MEERIIKDINNLLAQLFQKMKEAGYEWNVEKKELKKIEQKPTELSQEELDNLKKEIVRLSTLNLDADKNSKEISLWINYFLSLSHKQNPAEWSEEDEIIAKSLTKAANDCILYGYVDKHKLLDWLKSLKDRVQPKQEWSEEDEDAIGIAIIALDDMYSPDAPDYTYAGYSMPFNKAAERLKSLRHQNIWKPSYEMMGALNEAINNYANSPNLHENSYLYNLLYNLGMQLKKLREE